MQRAERDQGAAVDAVESTEEGPALRDAAEVAARSHADEVAASSARDRFRTEPIEPIAADRWIGPHLAEGEHVFGLRTSAMLKAPGDESTLGYGGRLYLTSRRLIHLGQVTVNVRLSDVTETSVVGDRLLVTLRHDEGLMFEVDRPRLFRTEIAAAMRGMRR